MYCAVTPLVCLVIVSVIETQARILPFSTVEHFKVKREVVETAGSVMETGINAASEVAQQGMSNASEVGQAIISGYTSVLKMPETVATTGMEKASETAIAMAENGNKAMEIAVKPMEKAMETFGGMAQSAFGAASNIFSG